MNVERLLLLWNADLSLTGGLAYVAQKLRGRDECALCELTYGAFGEKPRWKACKGDFGVPFEGVYRNHATDEQRRAAGDEFPCVLAQTSTGLFKLLHRRSIEECGGNLDRFADRLREALARFDSHA